MRLAFFYHGVELMTSKKSYIIFLRQSYKPGASGYRGLGAKQNRCTQR